MLGTVEVWVRSEVVWYSERSFRITVFTEYCYNETQLYEPLWQSGIVCCIARNHTNNAWWLWNGITRTSSHLMIWLCEQIDVRARLAGTWGYPRLSRGSVSNIGCYHLTVHCRLVVSRTQVQTANHGFSLFETYFVGHSTIRETTLNWLMILSLDY